MEVQVQFSFLPDTFDGNELANLIESVPNFFGFTANKIRCHQMGLKGDKFRKEHIRKIRSLDSRFKLALESRTYTGPQFSISHPGHSEAPQVLNWIVSRSALEEMSFKPLLSHNNFVSGYIYDADYVHWESEEFVSNYDYWKKPHAHLSKYFDRQQGMEMIDISKNPGRMVLVSKTWLGACWRMYFGGYFFKYISKNKLLSYKESFQTEEIMPDVVFIQLYEQIEESDVPENRDRQFKFRSYFDLDSIEDSLK